MAYIARTATFIREEFHTGALTILLIWLVRVLDWQLKLDDS